MGIGATMILYVMNLLDRWVRAINDILSPEKENTVGDSGGEGVSEIHVVDDMKVILLVDYSNMIQDAGVLKEDVISLVKAYLNFVGWKGLRIEADVRLYDGWDMMEDDGKSTMSRNAQEVCAVMTSAFPLRLGPCLVRVELARSLASQPTLHLKHTFRRRQHIQKVSVAPASDFCCDDARKMEPFLFQLIKKGRCAFCGKAASSILYAAEQKMVDTMMSLDVVYYGSHDAGTLVVASDDDDIMPAMLEVAKSGTIIYHLKKKKSLAYDDYAAIAGSNYKTIMVEE